MVFLIDAAEVGYKWPMFIGVLSVTLTEITSKYGLLFLKDKAITWIFIPIGISKSGEILDLAVDHDIVKKSGSWFSYGDTKLGQGRDAVKNLIEDNPELMEELEEKVLSAIRGEAEPQPEVEKEKKEKTKAWEDTLLL